MTNQILRNRICQLIAINYALDINIVINIYEKYNSFELILNACEYSIRNHISFESAIKTLGELDV